jgi:plasmid maintenance system antidote protein VapI
MSAVDQETTAAEVLSPSALLDYLMSKLNLKNDAALARALDVQPPVISKIRHNRLPIGATLLITMHELTGKTIAELRAVMGDRRAKFRGPFGAEVTGE